MPKKTIPINKKVLKKVLERLKIKNDICKEIQENDPLVKKVSFDARNIRPIVLLLSDTDNVPQEEWKTLLEEQIKRFEVDFNTVDPETGKSYSALVKPHIKDMFDNLLTADQVTDWNDERQVEKFICTILLDQATSTVINDFIADSIDVFPTQRERSMIDTKCSEINFNFIALDKRLRELGIDAKEYIPLDNAPSNTITSNIETYVSLGFNDVSTGKSEQLCLDPSSSDLMKSYLLNKDFTVIDDKGGQLEREYTKEHFERDMLQALENTSLYSPFERLFLGRLEIYAKGYSASDLISINGRSISDILKEKNLTGYQALSEGGKILRDALTDGESVVDLTRVGFENDGKATFTHQQIKVDLDKLNAFSRKENHNPIRRFLHNIGLWKIPDKFATNASRDAKQKQTEATAKFKSMRSDNERRLVDLYNSTGDKRKQNKNSILDCVEKLKYEEPSIDSEQFSLDPQEATAESTGRINITVREADETVASNTLSTKIGEDSKEISKKNGGYLKE